jgi:hypothetical protein
MDMKEKNKSTLQDALRNLPSHEPEEQVWNRIQHHLGKHENPLQEAIQQLPKYDPPATVWEAIETKLEQPGSKIRRLFPVYRVAAAAVLLIAAVAAWFLLPKDIATTAQLSHRVEMVDASLLQRDWKEDEADFEVVDQLCGQYPFICSNPDMLVLKEELKELTEAKESLENALGTYGTNPDLIGQIAEIELERTALLKQLLDRII